MPQSPLILSLDIGTSSARAMLFDAAVRELQGAEVRRAYEMDTTPDGGVQIDAERLVDSVIRCVDGLLATSGHGLGRIQGVGLSTFWHSLMGLDSHHRPTTPLYSWADTRSGARVDSLRRILDARRLHDRTGCPLHSSYWPAKLDWLGATNLQAQRTTKHWVGFPEYLYFRLFGKLSATLSMASGTGLLLQSDHAWDAELLGTLCVDEATLPALVDRDDAFDGLTGEWARRWPALARAAWYPAVGDGACSNAGSGCLDRSRAALMVGTSGAMRVVDGGPGEGQGEKGDGVACATPSIPASLLPSPLAPRPSVPPSLWSYLIDRRHRMVGGALSNGGNLFAWMRETLRLPDEPSLEAALAQAEPDMHGLTMLPFLAGERSLGWNPKAQAAILGMTLDTRPLDILRAGLEAVACRFSLLADALDRAIPGDKQIIASGGGLLSSPAWTQMVADALGRPITASAEPEASSRGAALLAAEALRLIPDVQAAPARLGRTFEPNEARHARYRTERERMSRCYELLIGTSTTDA